MLMIFTTFKNLIKVNYLNFNKTRIISYHWYTNEKFNPVNIKLR